ncbi:MAG TPA: hypothetical protein VF132_12680, partial [Rudaea sp.]
MPAREARAVALFAAAAATAFAIALYPGAMPFDAAYQWWQARGGTTSNVHGVGMLWLWRALDSIVTGPGALFVVQTAAFWCGLALIVLEIDVRNRVRMLIAAA